MTTSKTRVICISDKAYLGFDLQGNPRPPRKDETLSISLTVGKVYEVQGEHLGMYAIVDNTGEEFLFPKSRFRVIE